VFRKHPALPIKQIVQSQNTKYPMDKLVSPVNGFVWTDDSWRSIKANDSVEKVSMAAMLVLAHTNAAMPAYILKKNAERRGRKRGTQTESGLERRGQIGDLTFRMFPGRENPGAATSSDSAGMVGAMGHGAPQGGFGLSRSELDEINRIG
jgi:hypothetical protein